MKTAAFLLQRTRQYNIGGAELITWQSFIDAFGNITVLDVAIFIAAIVFLILCYRKVKDYLIAKHDADKLRDEQLKEALTAVRKYPEYRKQSIQIQHELEDENCAVRKDIQEFKTEFGEAMSALAERVKKMEEDTKRRERNKIRDRLLQNYRYYTNTETNPKQSWSRMEADAFWELFKEYEENGGDGYMHSEVQPAMNKLTIVEHETK